MRKKLLLLLLILVSVSAMAREYFEKPEEYSRTGKHYTELAPSASEYMGDPEWLYDLAWSYYEAGMNDDALRYILRTLELKPQMAFLNARAGDIYNALGKRDSAIVYYEKALNYHYEYIEVWEKIVELEPKYYSNLGLLYAEKGDEHPDKGLIIKGQEYLNNYLELFPDGEYSEQCRTAVSRLKLAQVQMESQEQLSEKASIAQAEEARRKAELKADRENFRKEKPYIVGFGFYSVVLSDDSYFKAKNPDEVIENELSLKHFAPNLNEFGFMAGYVLGPVFFRGELHYGTTSSGKNYFFRDPVAWDYVWEIDSSSTPWDSTLIDSTKSTDDDIRPKVSSVNSLRFSIAADYNFYYMNPVLLYIGGQADIGTVSLDEPHDNFDKITLSGAGLGGGIMLRFSDFLFDLSYRRNVVGSSAGGTITLMGLYKF